MAEKARLWGAAFTKEPSEVAWRFGQSIESDMNLLAEEIEVSIVHAEMLGQVGIISSEEAIAISQGLTSVLSDLSNPSDLSGFEDIHALVESKLKEKIGNVADKLHSGRSRNDQIATVTSLWAKRKSERLRRVIDDFQVVLVAKGEEFIDDPMPGYTHQQTAQPITLGYHLLAYAWMMEADFHLLNDFETSLKCPLGSGAVAGSSLPIERQSTAEKLGLWPPHENALNAVSSRDFVGNLLHACTTIMQHLSRLAQEIVLWSTAEFNFVRLDDSMSTGSSMMPQKRNPDFAELIRGRSSRAIGNYVTFMSMMKGLPLGYNRDMQDDKPPLFDSVQLCLDSLVLCREMLESAVWNLPRLNEMATAKFSTATAIAEALVLDGIPFRQAHEAVGKIVLYCEQKGKTLDRLDKSDALELGVPFEALQAGSLENALERKSSYGSPGKEPRTVQLREAQQILDASLPDIDS